MRRPGKMIRQVLADSVKKPATMDYPKNKASMPDGFRGRLDFDAPKCVGCKLCMKDCPSSAIEIVKVGEKKFEARIDLAKCIYCGQCVDSCNKKALCATNLFELARLNRTQLKIVLSGTFDGNPAEK